MNLEKIGPGKDMPNEINVIIEIPERSEPVKYEVDKATGTLIVDRFIDTANALVDHAAVLNEMNRCAD